MNKNNLLSFKQSTNLLVTGEKNSLRIYRCGFFKGCTVDMIIFKDSLSVIIKNKSKVLLPKYRIKAKENIQHLALSGTNGFTILTARTKYLI